jgi:alanyl-tRNA synthetase
MLCIVLDQTPFYAESGGQVGDTGELESAQYKFFVRDTQKEGEKIVHFIDRIMDKTTQRTLTPGDFDLEELPDELEARVDAERRAATMVHHTATHLLHAALRKVLGEHVQQKGSLVTPERLRFDFSHFEKVSDEQLAEIERLVNEQIRSANTPSSTKMCRLKKLSEWSVSIFWRQVWRACESTGNSRVFY